MPRPPLHMLPMLAKRFLKTFKSGALLFSVGFYNINTSPQTAQPWGPQNTGKVLVDMLQL